MGEVGEHSGRAGILTETEFRRRVAEIVDEIARHKWLESEKAGGDIGGNRAARDWMARHYELWKRAKGY